MFWLPRLLSILFAAFISLFALDVFSESHGLWQTLLALAIHLIPTAFVIVVIVIAWQWEWIGALLFFGAGSYYMLTALHIPIGSS